MARTTGTETELPNCLYACAGDTDMRKLSGKPCKRLTSNTDNCRRKSHNFGT